MKNFYQCNHTQHKAFKRNKIHEICTVIDKVHTYTTTTTEFPVILPTECKMQTDTCTVCVRIYPSVALLCPHTPPGHLHQPT